MGRSVSQSGGQSVSQVVNQSVGQSVGGSVSQSASQMVSQSVGRSVSQSVIHLVRRVPSLRSIDHRRTLCISAGFLPPEPWSASSVTGKAG